MFNKKGFTLVELMVVIVIIGILAVLAIPKLTGATVKAKVSELPTVLSSYDNSQLAYLAETGNLGTPTAIGMDQGTSKWWSYDGSVLGTYKGSLQTGINIPTILAAHYAQTVVSTAAVITHSATGGIQTLLPNWQE